MLTYNYECKNCGAEHVTSQRITDKPMKTCSTCGADSLERIISGGVGFTLRGSGWARDGYASSAS